MLKETYGPLKQVRAIHVGSCSPKMQPNIGFWVCVAEAAILLPQRALFLHSNDLELASNWLAERPPEGGQPTGQSLRASMAGESPTSSGPPSPMPVPPASSFPAAARGSPGIN